MARPAPMLLAIPALIAALAALTACTPNVADHDYRGEPDVLREHRGLPTDAPFPTDPIESRSPGDPAPGDDLVLDDPLLDGPRALLLDDGRVLAVVTIGSSSCHAVAESIEWQGASAAIRFGTTGGAVCTADLASHTHEFAVPDAVRGERLELELSFTDWDGIERLSVE
ncbi:hypothetical protein FLP10_14805 [Agromyces intestinalis]|uniref:Uncharacterized protein n=1 Tax=Agromyces intestinalis TaxID=2592652 RepID=A0A5C1YJY2_9MICO|nr:hypothetical protein [Agromyces intestinalis]QEO15560.1 hypothetical protein FLP10_14805 [Agromyces intestinalis]